MDELTAFLKARLDEDEAAARVAAGATGGHWLVTDKDRMVRHSDTPGKALVAGGLYDLLKPAHAIHIARHDPARVLREVEAKREILTAYIKVDADGHRGDGWIGLRFAVEALAVAWSDHPDYRAEWKP